jgi:hypothetical protein
MSDPEMTTFGMYPNWGVESCKSYAEQLRDKTRANRAEHAAECIEYLLSVVQKEWVGLTDEERLKTYLEAGSSHTKYGKAIEAKLKEKNT